MAQRPCHFFVHTGLAERPMITSHHLVATASLHESLQNASICLSGCKDMFLWRNSCEGKKPKNKTTQGSESYSSVVLINSKAPGKTLAGIEKPRVCGSIIFSPSLISGQCLNQSHPLDDSPAN